MDVSNPTYWRRRWDIVFRITLGAGGFTALALVIAIAGWEHGDEMLPWLRLAARLVLSAYAVGQFGRLLVAPSRRAWLRHRWPALLVATAVAVVAVEFRVALAWLETVFSEIALTELTLLFVGATQLPVIFDLGLRFLRFQEIFAERRVSPGAVMISTFGAMIVIGTFLLKMPRATNDGISWLDALFTSTSAVCVTGLNVVDTEATFTHEGKVIILLLIQVGGLGVMTLTTFLAAMFGSVSLRGRVLLQDLINEDNLGRIGRTLPLILLMTLAFEAAGAFALHAALEPLDDPRASGWFPAVFHSISAFCNAGFSIWSGGLYDPVVRGHTTVQGIVMVLVVAGGLGFPVMYATVGWMAGRTRRLVWRRQRRVVLSLHARLALATTAVLLVLGTIGFWLVEPGPGDAANATPAPFAALFNAVTARTAGFNIGPIEGMSQASVLLFCFLMFVGGCPGSTAGGVRTTAFAVALLHARRIVLGHDDVETGRRRISEATVARALAVIVLAITWIVIVSVALAFAEPGFALADLVFEVVSAVSTVGLTRAVTPELGVVGKVLIMLTMFAGRVGVLFFVLAFVRRRETGPLFRLPEENVLVA